jgi:hypothetical protein
MWEDRSAPSLGQDQLNSLPDPNTCQTRNMENEDDPFECLGLPVLLFAPRDCCLLVFLRIRPLAMKELRFCGSQTSLSDYNRGN